MAPYPMDAPRFALADRIARRLAGRSTADEATLRAIAILTTSADPERAERLRPRPKEPATLVERLAIWALPRANDQAIADALALLDDTVLVGGLTLVDAPIPTERCA